MNAKQVIKNSIRQGFATFGLDIRKRDKSTLERQVLGLGLHGIRQVIDVGANVGQFGRSLREGGFGGQIISFEPVSAAHEKLAKVASGYSNWIVAPRCAVGAAAGKTHINISANSVSSSLLPMLEAHSSAAKESGYLGKENVDVVALDDWRFIEPAAHSLLKIDTQGYEMHVLDGATRMIGEVKGIQLELSLTELYERQANWLAIVNFLDAQGFRPWNIEAGFMDPTNGRLLQIDATFYRTA
jgi:FkbM family methyltransferase